MTDTTAPAPPATAEWVIDDVAARALAVLRLRSDDIDADRVNELAAVACDRIDDLVDRPDADAPTSKMVEAAVALTVEMYAGGPVTIATSADGFVTVAGVRLLVIPDKRRWGVA